MIQSLSMHDECISIPQTHCRAADTKSTAVRRPLVASGATNELKVSQSLSRLRIAEMMEAQTRFAIDVDLE